TAIDERHAEAALGELQRDRGADNASAEHDHIETRHAFPFANICAARRFARGRRHIVPSPASGGGTGRGHATRWSFSSHPSPPLPRLRGRGRTELVACADNILSKLTLIVGSQGRVAAARPPC